jgi:hypothetical protein
MNNSVIRYPEAMCPACEQRGGVETYIVLQAQPIGSFFLDGEQVKLSARETVRVRCTLCGADGGIK